MKQLAKNNWLVPLLFLLAGIVLLPRHIQGFVFWEITITVGSIVFWVQNGAYGGKPRKKQGLSVEKLRRSIHHLHQAQKYTVYGGITFFFGALIAAESNNLALTSQLIGITLFTVVVWGGIILLTFLQVRSLKEKKK